MLDNYDIWVWSLSGMHKEGYTSYATKLIGLWDLQSLINGPLSESRNHMCTPDHIDKRDVANRSLTLHDDDPSGYIITASTRYNI